MESPKLFLTDYASYNNGTQFEFGHYVELDQFDDVDEFYKYIQKHFRTANAKSPGIFREETMFTDYENFPEDLYAECPGHQDLLMLFSWIHAEDEEEQAKIEFLYQQGYHNIAEMKSPLDDISIRPYDPHTFASKVEIYEEFYPEVTESPYQETNYDAFIENEFTEFQCYHGNWWLIMDGTF